MRKVRVISIVAAVAVLLAGCGGAESAAPDNAGPVVAAPSGPAQQASRSDPLGTAQPPAPAAQAPQPQQPSQPKMSSDFPSVEVADVGSGAQINLTTLAPSSTATLVWFYAPH